MKKTLKAAWKIVSAVLKVAALLASCAGKMTDTQFRDYTGARLLATDANESGATNMLIYAMLSSISFQTEPNPS